MFLIATPMMIYFMLFAKEGVFFLSGDAYAGAIIPMQVIMPTSASVRINPSITVSRCVYIVVAQDIAKKITIAFKCFLKL